MGGWVSPIYVLEPTQNTKTTALGKNVIQATKSVTRFYAASAISISPQRLTKDRCGSM
jgi:hypothetical protein